MRKIDHFYSGPYAEAPATLPPGSIYIGSDTGGMLCYPNGIKKGITFHYNDFSVSDEPQHANDFVPERSDGVLRNDYANEIFINDIAFGFESAFEAQGAGSIVYQKYYLRESGGIVYDARYFSELTNNTNLSNLRRNLMILKNDVQAGGFPGVLTTYYDGAPLPGSTAFVDGWIYIGSDGQMTQTAPIVNNGYVVKIGYFEKGDNGYDDRLTIDLRNLTLIKTDATKAIEINGVPLT